MFSLDDLIPCSGEDVKQIPIRSWIVPFYGYLPKSLPCDGGKDFLLKGGKYTLAISKERKEEVLSTYSEWVKKSEAVILV